MNFKTVIIDLPTTIPGFSKHDPDGYTTIVLNARMSYRRNRKTFLHELKHINKGDYDCSGSVDSIEAEAHK